MKRTEAALLEPPPLIDGCKPDSVLLSSASTLGATVIYLAPANLVRSSSLAATITRRFKLALARLGRRPRLLFCLAPHGVCRAPLLSPGAVGSYPAFSPLLHQSSSPRAIFAEVEDERSGIFSVTLSVAKNFRPALPRFRRACCLVVSGLSSPAFARSRSDRPPSIGRVP